MSVQTLWQESIAEPLGGEVIAWESHGKHYVAAVRKALADAGLDEVFARDFKPRHAFARACQELEDSRIIRKLHETDTLIHFQFTAEQKEQASGDQGRYDYKFEAILSLEKHSGTITCDDSNLKTMAEAQLQEALEIRRANDVTAIVQRIFKKQDADLFPIRDGGAVYFATLRHAELIGQVANFVRALGGSFYRLPIQPGTPDGDQTLQSAVSRGLASLIAEHENAVNDFDSDTRASTLERAAKKIAHTREKIACYAAYLGEERARLERSVAEVNKALAAKISGITIKQDDEPAEQPAEPEGPTLFDGEQLDVEENVSDKEPALV